MEKEIACKRMNDDNLEQELKSELDLLLPLPLSLSLVQMLHLQLLLLLSLITLAAKIPFAHRFHRHLFRLLCRLCLTRP